MNTDADRMNESDDDNTLPPPTPCRAAAAPNQIAVKSEEPLEVKVKLIKSEPDDDNALPLPVPTQQPYAAVPIKPEPLEVDAPDAPRRLVTPGPPAIAKPPARRTTRSSGSDLFDEKALAAARKIEYPLLRKRGWVHKNDSLYDWMWIPASIAGFKVEDILNYGEDGVHFARGDIGLCKMLQTYGLNHAPKDLDDFPEKNSFDIFELKDRVEKDLKEASKKAKSSNAAEPSGAQAIPTPARKRAKKSKPASKEELINENALLKDELARNKDELARKDDELAQLRLKWEQKWEQVQKVVGAPL